MDFDLRFVCKNKKDLRLANTADATPKRSNTGVLIESLNKPRRIKIAFQIEIKVCVIGIQNYWKLTELLCQNTEKSIM